MVETRKYRIYLDTSIISHLDAPDAPDRMDDPFRLWSDIRNGRYTVSISDITLGEMDRCSEPNRNSML
jgi:predicted nucleic acid-binding protein